MWVIPLARLDGNGGQLRSRTVYAYNINVQRVRGVTCPANPYANRVRANRRQAALNDLRGVASGKARIELLGGRAKLDISCVDKWLLFKHWLVESRTASGTTGQAFGLELNNWNVRRMCYQTDGSVATSVGLLVSDVLGNALDRGPAAAKQCKCTGDGLSQAHIGQTATFTIGALLPRYTTRRVRRRHARASVHTH